MLKNKQLSSCFDFEQYDTSGLSHNSISPHPQKKGILEIGLVHFKRLCAP